MTRFSRKPSPGMVVAMIALCLGVGGSAIAAGGLTKPQVKKIVKKQAKKQIKTLAPGLTVANAQHAVSADTAANADMLDSLDSTAFLQPICPAGTRFHEAACVETAIRAAANFDAATAACVNANRRLPSVAELQTFRLRVPISPPDGEWTSLEWENGATLRALLVGSNGLTDGSDQSVSNPFRCVATWP